MQAVDHSSSIVCSQASSESVLLQIAMPALPPVTATTDSDEPDPPRKRPSKKAKASPKKTPKKDEALPEKTPTKPKSKASPKASCGCVIASMSYGFFFCLHFKMRCGRPQRSRRAKQAPRLLAGVLLHQCHMDIFLLALAPSQNAMWLRL